MNNKKRAKEQAIKDTNSEYRQYMAINTLAIIALLSIEYAYDFCRSFYGVPYTLIIYMIAFKLNSTFYKGILTELAGQFEKVLYELEKLERKYKNERNRKSKKSNE